MNRKTKTLGATLLAMVAVAVGGPASASAVNWDYNFEQENVWFVGQSEAGESFSFNNWKITCKAGAYIGSLGAGPTKKSGSIPLEPAYGGCEIGGINLAIDPENCFYFSNAKAVEAGNFEGTLDIFCGGAGPMKVTVPGCTITIPEQSLKTVTTTNVGIGAKREVTLDVNLTGLVFVEDNAGLFPTCEAPGKQTVNGTYSGTIIVKAQDKGGKQFGIWAAATP